MYAQQASMIIDGKEHEPLLALHLPNLTHGGLWIGLKPCQNLRIQMPQEGFEIVRKSAVGHIELDGPVACAGWSHHSPSARRVTTERHHGAGRLSDQAAISSCDVADVAADGSSKVNGGGNGLECLIPDGSEEVDLEIDGGETLSFLERGCVRYANGGIGKIAEDSAVNGAHRIGLRLGVGRHCQRRGAFADLNQHKAQCARDRRRVSEAGP
jgi:hypothetical protein